MTPIDFALTKLAPAWRVLADALVVDATERTIAAGSAVSCRAGCGACCRQLVPLLPAEAVVLTRLVEAMPDERRAVVVGRGRELRRRADEAGLGAELDALGGPTLTSRYRPAASWFALGLACPFLDDESCTIHAERPLACREYLASSDPVHCADPTQGSVVRVELRGSAQEAAKQAARAVGGSGPRDVTTLVDVVAAVGK